MHAPNVSSAAQNAAVPGAQRPGARVIFVLVDGLGAFAAPHMGWLAAMTEAGRARYQTLECALPPLSRPLYHCLFTGQLPADSGIVNNVAWRPPAHAPASVFALARDAGLTTAAAAYYWMSELFNRTPFDPGRDRLTSDPALALQHGVFYSNDAYPDDHVFMDAEALRLRNAPDILLVHTMGVDLAGHLYGGNSKAYREAVRGVDMLLSAYMPQWIAEGYTIIVSSDHGMHPDGAHNDTDTHTRHIPLWHFCDNNGSFTLPLLQNDIRDFLCAILCIDSRKKNITL